MSLSWCGPPINHHRGTRDPQKETPLDIVYAFVLALIVAMLYDIRRDIRLSQQSLEHIAAMAKAVSDKTDAILGRLR